MRGGLPKTDISSSLRDVGTQIDGENLKDGREEGDESNFCHVGEKRLKKSDQITIEPLQFQEGLKGQNLLICD